VAQAGELLDPVIADVDGREFRAVVEALDNLDAVVTDVQFLEVREFVEALDLCDAVVLDRQQTEVRKRVEALDAWDLVARDPQRFEVHERLEVRNFPDTVRTELEVREVHERVDVLNTRNSILAQKQLLQVGQALDVPNVPNVVEAQVEHFHVVGGVEVLEVVVDAFNEVVVKIEILEVGRQILHALQVRDHVAAEACVLCFRKPLQPEVLEAVHLHVREIDLLCILGQVVEEILVGVNGLAGLDGLALDDVRRSGRGGLAGSVCWDRVRVRHRVLVWHRFLVCAHCW